MKFFTGLSSFGSNCAVLLPRLKLKDRHLQVSFLIGMAVLGL